MLALGGPSALLDAVEVCDCADVTDAVDVLLVERISTGSGGIGGLDPELGKDPTKADDRRRW